MKKPLTPILAALLTLLACQFSLGQDEKSDKPNKKADDYRAVAEEIRNLVADKKIDKAAEALDAAIEKADEKTKPRMASLYATVARGYTSARKYKKSSELHQKSFEYYIENIDQPGSASRAISSLRMMNTFSRFAGNRDEVFELGKKTLGQFDAKTEKGKVNTYTSAIASLLAMQVTSPSLKGDDRKAVASILDAQIDNVSKVYAKNKEALQDSDLSKVKLAQAKAQNNSVLTTYSSLLSSASMLFSKNKKKASDFEKRQFDLVATALKDDGENVGAARAYSSVVMTALRRSYRDDPEAARAMIEKATKALAAFEDDKSMSFVFRQFESYEGRIKKAEAVKKLIGQTAPEFQIDAWANNESNASVESLKGKVVLLDFWAVWCGPCVATFPHLKKLREEFGDRGFEVVGVTRYYGYKWDEEKEKAVRPKRGTKKEDFPSPKTEHAAVAKFLQSHNLKHPTIFVSSEATMNAEYGVSGIPHAVVIDRKGKVRLIKVGSGKANADAIHDMVKKLIEDE